MNYNKIFSGLTFLVAVSALVIAFVMNFKSEPRLGYVVNSALFEKSFLVKDTETMFEEKKRVWESNLDTLEKEIDSYIDAYKTNFNTFSEKQRIENENFIKKRQQEYFEYKKVIDENIEKEDEKLTLTVLNQMNNLIDEYGKRNDYDIIIGGNDSGNLLFAKEEYDITEEVLDFINEKYTGNIQ